MPSSLLEAHALKNLSTPMTDRVERRSLVNEYNRINNATRQNALNTTLKTQDALQRYVNGDKAAEKDLFAANPQVYMQMQKSMMAMNELQKGEMIARAKKIKYAADTMDDMEFLEQVGESKDEALVRAGAILAAYEKPSYGTPQEMIRDGQRVFVQTDDYGDTREIEGYTAPLPSSAYKAGTAPMQNYQRRLQLVEQFGEDSPQVRTFDNYVRSTKWQDLGATVAGMGPGGNIVSEYEKTIPPEQTPEHKRNVSFASAAGQAEGKGFGEASTQYQEMKARLPRLEALVGELSALGKKATYTYAGQGMDFMRRQAGLDPTENAVARAEYISKVDNEILPLLRLTFGAQFTVEEGNRLRATLGDDNAHPEEKEAVLRSFIMTKIQNMATQERMVQERARAYTNQSVPYGGQAQPTPGINPVAEPPEYTNYGPRVNDAGGIKFLGFE